MPVSTSTQRLLPYLANFAVVLVVAAASLGQEAIAYKAWGFLPLLAGLVAINVVMALGLLVARRGGLASSFAVSALLLVLLAGLAAAAPLVALVVGGKIGG